MKMTIKSRGNDINIMYSTDKGKIFTKIIHRTSFASTSLSTSLGSIGFRAFVEVFTVKKEQKQLYIT